MKINQVHYSSENVCKQSFHEKNFNKKPLYFSLLAIIYSILTLNTFAVPVNFEEKFNTGLDSQGQNPFALNPSFYFPSSSSLLYGSAMLKNKITMKNEGNNLTTVTSHVQGETQGLGFFIKAGNDLGLGVHGTYDNQLHLNHNDNNFFYKSAPAKETKESFAAVGRFLLQITQNIRLGSYIKYQTLNHSILGNFSFMEDDMRTKLTGSLFGMCLGGSFSPVNNFTVGLSYFIPMTGKIKGANGETYQSSLPGSTAIDTHYELASFFSLGLAIRRWNYQKDELMDFAEPPLPLNNQTTFLKGLSPDEMIFPMQSTTVGMLFGKKDSLNLALSVYQLKEEFVPTRKLEIPGEGSGRSGRTGTWYGAKSRLGIASKSFSFALMADYSFRKYKPNFDDNATNSYFSRPINYLAQLSYSF